MYDEAATTEGECVPGKTLFRLYSIELFTFETVLYFFNKYLGNALERSHLYS
jgi:hypothetical protein